MLLCQSYKNKCKHAEGLMESANTSECWLGFK